jgi:rare lipoprotein A
MGGGNAPVTERGEGAEPKPAEPAVTPAAKKAPPVTPADTTPTDTPKKGGYYLDDGPGANPPPDLDSIPDAIPRIEAIRPANSRPYSALGQDYTPMTALQPYKASGIASWYGRRYHGQKTSSGEVYDMYGMTAAHTVLPIPCFVRVTNPENGRSVVVRVNDRGPFKHDRLIDLSYAAAHRLNIVKRGSGFVEVELIDPRLVAPQLGDGTPAEISTAPLANHSGIYIQLGAFRQLKQQGLAEGLGAGSWYNGELYRVRLGPYNNTQEAEAAAANLKQTLGVSALVITQ